MVRRLTIATLVPLFILGLGAKVRAQDEATAAPETPAQPSAEAPAASPAEAPAAAAPAASSNPPQFGGAFRARWITLPSWFLGMFTKANQPLSSYGIGIEGFRRKRDAENPNRYWEISLGLGYQNMSPSDGNWLGKGHDASVDTDWVQFKNFGFWTIDFSFIARQYFNDVVGIHYGAGLGLAIIQGDILRTSSSPNCSDQNLNTPACRPLVCTGGVCTEAELSNSSKINAHDSATTPSRFREGSVPGAIPILNLLFGMDFRIPQTKGLELRLDAGFFDALFLGGAVAYVY